MIRPPVSPSRLLLSCLLVLPAFACTTKEEPPLDYLVTPATLELGESYYDDKPATGTVSFLNQDDAIFYITPTAVTGDGADLLALDTSNFKEIGPDESGDLTVSIVEDMLAWDEGEGSATVTFTLDANRGGGTSLDPEDNWLRETLDIPVSFGLHCDLDGDGYESEVCAGEDCDDNDDEISPSATEVCDNIDNDCDGDKDEDDAEDALLWYQDADGDHYGNLDATTYACEKPESYEDNSSDCDDGNANNSPVSNEVCDEVDNDCDGSVDEDDAVDPETWYTDADADGYGDHDEPQMACDAPVGTVANDDDCNDSSDAQSPANTEVCDELDNDCDGAVDEDECL